MKAQKYNTRQILKAAHAIARTLDGHYAARLAEGLRMAWAAAKAPKAVTAVDIAAFANTLPACSAYVEGASVEIYYRAKKGVAVMVTLRGGVECLKSEAGSIAIAIREKFNLK